MTLPLAITGPHLTALVAAVVWLGYAIYMKRRGELDTEKTIIAVIGVVGLVLFGAGVFAQLPQPEKVLEDISGKLGKWTYLLVGVLAFLETGAFIGLVAPGEAAVIVGGVVAGQGDIDLLLLIGIVWFAAFMGDTCSYFIGRRLGREFLVKHGPRVKISEARLIQVEGYMRDHGGKTILVGRFIGLVRALAPFIAGSSKLPYRRFLPYDIIGSGLWAATFCLLGYIFSNNLQQVINTAEKGVLIFGWVVGLIVAIVYLVRRFRKPEERAKASAWLDEQEKNPRLARLIRPVRKTWNRALLPIVRFFEPQAKFAWDRFTPGGLGLEFTTTFAVWVLAGFTFYFFLVAALDWPTVEFVTRINNAAFRISDSIRTEWLDSLAKIVTNLGALPVVGAFTVVAAGYCLSRKRIPEATVLVVSLIVTAILSTVVKNWTDVPRPSDPLVATTSSSFPSGHSAYAVSYVAIAITLERIRDLFTRAAVVFLAIGVAAAVGLSRVYLRAHYLSDVIGGWSLAFLVFATFTVIAFVITYLIEMRRGEAEAGEIEPSPTDPAAAADKVE